jgi:aspartyl-tRNA(Asn)/glutamyl-tRNA(Gln) amidotransferase subunit A
VDEARLPDGFDDVWPQHARLLAFEAAAVHHQRRTGPPDCLPPRLRTLLETGRAVSGAEVEAARRCREVQRQAIQRLLEGPTFLIGPAATGAAPGPETTGDAVMNAPWSFLGLPTLALPLALDAGGLPLGLQLIGPEGAESLLLRAGVAIERILRHGRTGSLE